MGVPGAFGFAIISITLAIRFLMLPFFQKQIDTSRKMQEIKPELDKLQKKYKNDQKKLQQEQMKLYQSAGINPAAGCLVAIVQIPIFIGLYQTLQQFLHTGQDTLLINQINSKLYYPFLKINSAIDPHFLWINLTLSPSKGGNIFYYLVPVITAGLQYLQNIYTMPQMPVKPAAEVVVEKDTKDPNKKPEEKSVSDEFQQAMNTQMKYFFPLMIGYFSYTLPIGLSLYWNLFSVFSIVQQIIANKKRERKS